MKASLILILLFCSSPVLGSGTYFLPPDFSRPVQKNEQETLLKESDSVCVADENCSKKKERNKVQLKEGEKNE